MKIFQNLGLGHNQIPCSEKCNLGLHCLLMSFIMDTRLILAALSRIPVFSVSVQVGHKPACKVARTSKRLDISDLMCKI